MSRIGRRVRSAVNPVSTAATRWWCQSGMRRVATGYGPTAEQRRLIREMRRGADPTPNPEQMEERAAAIGQLLGRDDHHWHRAESFTPHRPGQSPSSRS